MKHPGYRCTTCQTVLDIDKMLTVAARKHAGYVTLPNGNRIPYHDWPIVCNDTCATLVPDEYVNHAPLISRVLQHGIVRRVGDRFVFAVSVTASYSQALVPPNPSIRGSDCE